jgi:uncharacterized protein involved in exopolysaccharide biosynthesis
LPEDIQSSLPADDEISLLDLLVTVADNLKLLILGPLAAGLAALALAFGLPQTFQSVALLQADAAVAGLMTTAPVLDRVAEKLGLLKKMSVDEARLDLQGRIKAAVGRNDKFLTLTASAPSREQAQTLAQEVLLASYAQTQPKGTNKARLELQLRQAQERLKNAEQAAAILLTILDRQSKVDASKKSENSELPRSYAELLGTITAAQGQISGLEAQLEGVSDSQLIQAPTLPEKAVSNKKGQIAIGATLGTGFLLLLWVFARSGLRNAAADPSSAAKLQRIRAAIRRMGV